MPCILIVFAISLYFRPFHVFSKIIIRDSGTICQFLDSCLQCKLNGPLRRILVLYGWTKRGEFNCFISDRQRQFSVKFENILNTRYDFVVVLFLLVVDNKLLFLMNSNHWKIWRRFKVKNKTPTLSSKMSQVIQPWANGLKSDRSMAPCHISEFEPLY